MNQGVYYFNFGAKCALRLMISVFTLRKVYNGNISVALANNDVSGVNPKLSEDLGRLGVDVMYYDFNPPCRRNSGYTIKPEIINQAPYDINLFLDSDTIILKDIQPLMNEIEGAPTLLTQFSTWQSNGQRISKRIRQLSDVLSAEQIQEALNAGPAINTGVMGFTRGASDAFMKDWIDTTYLAKCRFIVDEIACQCMFFKHKNKVMDHTWNNSVVYDKLKDANILHMHGRKHAATKREGGRLWWTCVSELENAHLIQYLDDWKQLDKQVANMNKPIIECEKEEEEEVVND